MKILLVFISFCGFLAFSAGQQDSESLFLDRISRVGLSFFNSIAQIVNGTDFVAATEVTFWCANLKNKNYTQVFMDDPKISQKIDSSKPILILTHGWTDNVNKTWVKNTVNDYLKYIDGNICAMDWSQLATREYNMAAGYTLKVGAYMGQFLQFLFDSGFPISQVTLVGHSMGAHIVGIAGSKLNGKIPLIIGLDPAGPAFTKPFLITEAKRLDPSDGVFVQVLHTDKYIIGEAMNLGDQDYYPNDGITPQPGCEFSLISNDTTKSYMQFICSHFKAVEYFRSSLNKANVFKGTACANYLFFQVGLCSKNRIDTFGIYSRNTSSGALFFRTSKTFYPYV